MYPYNSQLYQQLIPPIQNKQEVVKVNGRAGAEAYHLDANSSSLLLDQTAPIVWLVQTDGAGYKSITGYDITEHKEEKPIDAIKALEDRIAKLEETINAKQSNSANVTKRKSEPTE